ncbi:D-alanyl-D-alanine carboxypeptidase [Candidatus Parcubacteria bacterium]|nr:MAG: D-alanyl-D-alanine carboxypeptidase [Candidatus Parcubacteria bacterium]
MNIKRSLISNKIKSLNWKIFWIGFVAGFLGIFLSQLGLRPPQFLQSATNQVQKSQVNIFNISNSIVEEKIKDKTNDFQLRKDGGSSHNINIQPSFNTNTSYVVVDYDTGEILAEKNMSEKQQVASLTKIMTAIVSLDLASPQEIFSVSGGAAMINPTKIGVVEGQKMTLSELLQATLLTSANDAAEVIKEGIDNKYGKESFIKAMNGKASFIGLKNTRFDNPQGFDSENNYSTAYDLAVLSGYALKNYPLIAETVRKDYEFLSENENHKQFDLYNWNGLLDVYPNIKGIKIGNTDRAGYTTIVMSERENKRVLVVLLGAPGVIDRDLWASQLLDIGFNKQANLASVNITEQELQTKYSTWKFWN